jgi:hypothetical protein
MPRTRSLLWVGAGLAGVVALVLRRRVRGRGHQRREPVLGERWQCECCQRFSVAGRDRHRIYWLEGAAQDDPVLDNRCPSCDRPLPAQSGVAAAAA